MKQSLHDASAEKKLQTYNEISDNLIRCEAWFGS